MTFSRLAIAVLATVALAAPQAQATFPYPSDSTDFTTFHITNGDCDDPANDIHPSINRINDWKFCDSEMLPGDSDYDPTVANNPQELYGVRGPGTPKAWEYTTGRPDVVIAVMDSGIRWDENRPDLVNKFFLNAGELPHGDINGDGFVNVKDFAADGIGDINSNGLLDPQDLIHTFSDGVDDDGNGYIDDISGWDFFENDNDPNDDVNYGHGTGESEDSAGEIGINGRKPQCPNCMLLEMRVGDSFVADINHWAEAVVYAVDNGASVVQEALGTLNHTRFAQDAADYAWENGVLVVASQADESAGHHNFPAALNHTMLVNSILPNGDVPVVPPQSYLEFNGCTNFGGYSWLSIPSTSCSSDATGQSAGMAGLLYSAAKNAVAAGTIADRNVNGRPISASEAKQLFRAGADDIDFSTPQGGFPPNNFTTKWPASQRFVTTDGWDQITGWGRVNIEETVNLIRDGNIPPEADITAPRWWQPLQATGTIEVEGSAAAPREDECSWKVEIAGGVQPPKFPAPDLWVEQSNGDCTTDPNVSASIDLAMARVLAMAAQPYNPVDDPTSRDLPEKDAVRIRLTVSDDNPDSPDSVEQRQIFVRPDAELEDGFPTFLEADGGSSPKFVDLGGDPNPELLVADGNGRIRGFEPNGDVVFDVSTDPIPLPSTGDNAYTRGDIPASVNAPILLGSPAVANIDGEPGLEVVAADLEGRLYAWHTDGTLLTGFPQTSWDPYSRESKCAPPLIPNCDDFHPWLDSRDDLNTVDFGFTAQPALANIDSDPELEIVIGSNDGHVYVFNHDGTYVPGWPVLLRDPEKVAAVDPDTHLVTYKPGSGARFGRKIITTPSIGDLDGDGDLDIVVNVNEEYKETPNTSAFSDPALQAVGVIADTGNTRTYALDPKGWLNGVSTPNAHPEDQAYLPGWPVKVPMLTLELLPYVGEGSNGAPALADLDGDGTLEVGTASIAGPPMIFNHDGTSYLGQGPDGVDNALSTVGGNGSDYPSYASLGGGVFGKIGASATPNFAMGATGLRRLLDVILPEQQLGGEDHISAWDTTTGKYLPGFPGQVNDLMFFNTPAIADVTGDGLAEVIQGSAMYDLAAYSQGGVRVPTFPKYTGGWIVTTPTVGDWDGDGRVEVAIVTREGNLFVWNTPGLTCGTQWPGYQANAANTGNYSEREFGIGIRLDVITQVPVPVTAVAQIGIGRCGQLQPGNGL